MKAKQRLSASVDTELLQAAQSAVEDGRAESVSAWVNDALRLKAEHESRMQALDSFLADYEAKHGAITDVEMDEAVHRTRGRATVVRSSAGERPGSGRGVA